MKNCSKTSLTIRYCFLLGFYWGSVFCVTGFASEFLLSRDFTNSQIGIVVALGNILAVILQPVIASIADRSKKICVHHLVIALGTLAVLCFGALAFTGSRFWAVASLFVLSVTLLQILQPLTNSISIYYVNRGLSINFGLPRAIGSTAYGLLSFSIGFLVERFSPTIDIYIGACVLLFLVGATLMMPILKDNKERSVAIGEEAEEEKTIEVEVQTRKDAPKTNLFQKYPNFMVALVGIMFVFMFHQFFNCYLIQILEPIGGNSQIKGIAVAIQAIVELPPMILFAKFSKKFGAQKLLVFGVACFAIKAIVTAFITAAWQIYPVMLLQIFSYAIYIPASVQYVNEIMDDEDKYKGQAIMVSSNTLGNTFGTLLGGFVIDAIGVHYTNFIFAGLCTVGSLITILALSTRKKKASAK